MGIHTASSSTIRTLTLADVDLPNRRITINKVARPLDDLTHQALIDYLNERRVRWPYTANPYVLLSRQTAGTSPVSTFYLQQSLLPHG